MIYRYSYETSPPIKGKAFFVSAALHAAVVLLVVLSPYIFAKKKTVITSRFFQVVNVQPYRPQIQPPAPQPEKPPVKKEAPKPPGKKPKIPKPAPALTARMEQKSQPMAEPEPESAEPMEAVQVAVANQGFQYDWYLANIIAKVESNWRPPRGLPGEENLTVVVFFKILRSGQIGELRLDQGSGVETLDNLGLRAIQRAAPFPRLPPRFSEDELNVTFKLNYLR